MTQYPKPRWIGVNKLLKEIEDVLATISRRKPGEQPDYNVSDMLWMMPEGTRFLVTLRGHDRNIEGAKQTAAGVAALESATSNNLHEGPLQVRVKDTHGRVHIMLLKCGPLLNREDILFAQVVMPHIDEIVIYPITGQGAFTYSPVNWLQYSIETWHVDEA